MGKILLLLLGIAAVLWLIAGRRRPPRDGVPPPVPRAEDMVRCAHCGVHLPRSEGVSRDGLHFCGEEHLRAHGAERT